MDQQCYILKPSLNEKETGMAYPAVISYPDYDFDGPRSIYKIRSDYFPDFVPDLRFKLARGAKLCDMMTEATSGVIGLLVSTKIFKILNEFYICPHRYYDVMIETKTGVEKYHFLHLVWKEKLDYIIWEKSVFYYTYYGEKRFLNINNYSEYEEKTNELNLTFGILCEKMVLNDVKFDLFFNPLSIDIFISENLKNSLINNKISGLDIKQNTRMEFEDKAN